MYVDKLNTVFVHIPKTGGNFIQDYFFNQSLTSDIRSGKYGRDGIQRFEVTGHKTERKHQSLSDYIAKLDPADNFRFLTVYREPTERLLSLFNSPHRLTKYFWKGTNLRAPFGFGKIGFDQLLEIRQDSSRKPSPRQFQSFIRKELSSFELLSLGPNFLSDFGQKKITILDFENLRESFSSFFQDQFGQVPELSSQRLNKGPLSTNSYSKHEMEMFRSLIRHEKHQADYCLREIRDETITLFELKERMESSAPSKNDWGS